MRARPSLARAPARGEVKLHHYRRLPLQPPLFLLRLKLLAERLQTLRQPFARSSGWPRLQVPKMRILRPMQLAFARPLSVQHHFTTEPLGFAQNFRLQVLLSLTHLLRGKA